MQSRVSKIENRMKEAHEDMGNLKKENRKLRRTQDAPLEISSSFSAPIGGE